MIKTKDEIQLSEQVLPKNLPNFKEVNANLSKFVLKERKKRIAGLFNFDYLFDALLTYNEVEKYFNRIT